MGPATLKWSVGSSFMEAKGAAISKHKSNALGRTLDFVYSGFPVFMASNNIL